MESSAITLLRKQIDTAIERANSSYDNAEQLAEQSLIEKSYANAQRALADDYQAALNVLLNSKD